MPKSLQMKPFAQEEILPVLQIADECVVTGRFEQTIAPDNTVPVKLDRLAQRERADCGIPFLSSYCADTTPQVKTIPLKSGLALFHRRWLLG